MTGNITGSLLLRRRNAKPTTVDGAVEKRTIIQVVGVIALDEEHVEDFTHDGKHEFLCITQGAIDEDGNMILKVHSNENIKYMPEEPTYTKSADGVLHSYIWRV